MTQEIKSPILIIGIPRSGTSMTGGIVNICGAWGGDMRKPNRNNPKGMFENKFIVNDIIKPLLRKNGFDPMGQKPLPDDAFVASLKDQKDLAKQIRKQVISGMVAQGLKTDVPWFYKGLKMTLLWPLFHLAFPNSKWIIVRRDAEDIVNSCLRTSFMRAYQKRSGWLKWVAAHEKRFEEMADAGVDIREVWPQRMIAGDFTEMQIVINDLGLNWDFDAVRNFVDPGLWRKWKARRK